jgi:hypothetical protein
MSAGIALWPTRRSRTRCPGPATLSGRCDAVRFCSAVMIKPMQASLRAQRVLRTVRCSEVSLA